MTLHELRALLRLEHRANAAFPKSQLIVALFRIGQYLRSKRGPLGRAAWFVYAASYRIVVEWIFTIELPLGTRIGPGLQIWHGQGLTVNPNSILGANVLLRHGVTIGNLRSPLDCPIIEDDVQFGAGAVVIGSIRVGHGAIIGPNVVVTTDVPPESTVFPPVPEIKRKKSTARFAS